MTKVVFRENGKPRAITGTIRCPTCGTEFPAESILSVDHGEKESRLAISHPPGHRVSFATEGPNAVSLFVIHKQ